MAKKPYPKRALHPAEQKDGVHEAEHRGQKFEKHIETKMGSDGVEEHHITYLPRKNKTFFIPR